MTENVFTILPSDLDTKTVSIILLSNDNLYISSDGKLPKRPPFDKELITKLAENNTVLCSENTYPTIPPSIRKVVKELTMDPNSNWNVNFGINTFKLPTDYFIIVKSPFDLIDGKVFNIHRIEDKYTHVDHYNFENDFKVIIYSNLKA